MVVTEVVVVVDEPTVVVVAPVDVGVTGRFSVVVVSGTVVVVVVVGVTAVFTIASTVTFEGGGGVTPLGKKAIVTRRYCENLIVLGSVVIVGVFCAIVVQ